MSSILVAESIAKSYGVQRVLTAARLRAEAGAVTFVAGRNGSGKSTLLRICAGVLAPDQGTIRLGSSIRERVWLHELARRGLFYLPDRDILSPGRSVRVHLEAISQRYGERRSIAEVADSLQIGHCLDRASPDISGGERRRAEIALAIVRSPVCLIADEPLRGIDPRDRSLVVGALEKLAEAGSAVVISGHETADLLEPADLVTWVTSGTTYEIGSGAHALRHERFRREYLTGAWCLDP